MSKRPSPFENHIGRQLKVHLFDYENDAGALKNVQERTITKLIEGSRRLYSGEVKVSKEAEIDVVQHFERERNPRQKCITDYFRQI